MMKRWVGVSMALLLLSAAAAQVSYLVANDSAGIYFSYEDFQKGRIANPFPPRQKQFSLWPRGFFRYGDLVLQTPDTSLRFKRSAAWGFVDHRNYFYRVSQNRYYKLLCDKGINLYILYSPTRATYYFSKTYNDRLYLLSKKNLKKFVGGDRGLLKKIKATRKKDWLHWNATDQLYHLNQLFLTNISVQ